MFIDVTMVRVAGAMRVQVSGSGMIVMNGHGNKKVRRRVQ